MDTALYFPYMRVPDNSWFTRVVLYWDRAASIVPDRFREDDEELGSYTLSLAKYHLIDLISPREALASTSRPFDEQFLNMLDAQEVRPLDDSTKWERLHVEKGRPFLFQELADRGLAHMSPNFMWFEVEARAANLYMAYLVGSLCRESPTMYPVTDSKEALTALAYPGDNPADRFRALRYAAITHALPVPSGRVSPEDLARFKERYADKLGRLRCHLNGQLADIAAIDDPYMRDIRVESVLQEIRDDVAVISEQMTKRQWPRVLFSGIAGVVGVGLAAGAVIATGGTALALGLGVGAAAASMGPAAYQAADLFARPRFDARAPLAYAALAGGL